jgi:hypothetical protein
VFHALASDVDALRAFSAQRPTKPTRPRPSRLAMSRYRARLDACRQAVNRVYAHLEGQRHFGGMAFELRQLRAASCGSGSC